MKIPALVLVSMTALCVAQAGPLRLHTLFSENAVLQQELPVPVWGWGEPGENVEVEFAGQVASTKINEDGRWQVVLAPLEASFDPQALTIESGAETLKVGGVLVGEVWVGSGQSNMAWAVRNTLSVKEVLAAVESDAYEGIRLFKVPVEGADERRDEVDALWMKPSVDSVSSFSATAFYFAAKLLKDRKVPVGVIQSASGGTNAYSWINRSTYEEEEIGETIRSDWQATVERFPDAMVKYEAAKAEWEEKAKAAKAAGKAVPRAPQEPRGPGHVKRPTGHYHAMVAPLQPCAIRGVIWYQGEANSRLPHYPEYKELMLALAEDWRSDWAEASGGAVEERVFPFYLVQLPNFAGGNPEGWPMIREQMLKFWQEGEKTGMVVAIDTGDANDIHPQNKRPVGERLALFARGNVYGEDVTYSGPVYDHLQIEGNQAVVHFTHVGSGLKSLDGEALKYFEVAGGDGKFKEAVATIRDATVVVESSEVQIPRAVRYAWKANPEGANLGNESGLPASPFRTDNW